MSELLNKIIKRVYIQPEPWHRNNGWYGHIVYFTDGTKGEIFECTESNPEYLQEGKPFIHETRPNKYPDKPYLLTEKKLKEIKEREQQKNEPSSQQNTSYNRFEKRSNSNSGGGWKGYGGRYEDSPDIWLQKQKFISVLKFYEVLIPLIIKGDIKYENLHEEVDKHLKHILEKSGMNNLPIAPVSVTAKQSTIPSHIHIQKSVVKNSSSVTPPAKKDTSNDRMTHTIGEVLAEPDVSPELYTQESPAELFAEDSNLSNESAPVDILEKISKCSKKAQLTALQRILTVEQLKDKNIMNAFFAQKNKISNKK